LHNIHFHFHFLKKKGDPAEKATIVGGSIKTTKMSLQKCMVPKKN
jgi:hypothetical protein